MSLEIGLALVKMALPSVTKAIAATVQTKLHPSELEQAIATALEASGAVGSEKKTQHQTFYRCELKKIDQFLAQWLEHSAVQVELQKPLQQEGLPDIEVLVKAAEQVGNDRAIPIAPAHLESWLTRFAQAYFDRTSECLRFRVAQTIRQGLERGSEYERWLHRDLLFAGRCLAEDPKDLNEGDQELAEEIFDRLVELEVSKLLEVGHKVYQEVFEILCNLNDSAFESETLQRLKAQVGIDEDRLRKYQAALGEIEIVTGSLLSRFTDENLRVSSSAALALYELGNASETVVQSLLSRLTDEDWEVRSITAWVLGTLGNASKTVVQSLLSRLTDENLRVRCSAAEALGTLGNASETVVQSLLSRLTDEDWEVRCSAAEALSTLGNASETVVQALLSGLAEEDWEARSSAAEALGKLGKTADWVEPAVVQWIEQHQDSPTVGSGIDALWQIVSE